MSRARSGGDGSRELTEDCVVKYVSPWLVNQKLGIKERLHLGIVAVFRKTRTKKKIDELSDGTSRRGAEAATSKKSTRLLSPHT